MAEKKGFADRPILTNDLSLLGLAAPVSPEERPRRALEELIRMRKELRSLVLYLDLCTHCGACYEQCHTYLGTRDPNNSPVGRADLLRKVYNKYFTFSGRLFGNLVGAKAIDQETVEQWYKYFYQCNECRRCAIYCPFGIDTAEITIAARRILANLGMVPKFIMDVATNACRTGNNMGIPPRALADSVSFLEEELEEETGMKIRIPIDDEGAEVLLNPSSSEFFSSPDTLMGTAKMFHAAGTRWTLSSRIVETANFGLFFNFAVMKEHNKLLLDEARRLRVRRVVAGECGHGWRTWRMFTSSLNGPTEFPIVHVQQETVNYMRGGRIRLDPSANPERVTLHDPCNMARAGGLIEEPRIIMRNVASDFREMYPNRERNFCCGGGGGLLMDEMMELRMKFGKPKADQVTATGAAIVAAPCAICKAQLPHVMEYWKTGAQVKGLMDLVGRALVL